HQNHLAIYRASVVWFAQWQRTACPLPSHRPARAAGGDEDKGLRLAGTVWLRHLPHGEQTRADSPGRFIMTENKAQKAAIRERMAETGEPYSVARHAVLSGP